jgi:alpha-tubulin suppressor-like RCC1 family protein
MYCWGRNQYRQTCDEFFTPYIHTVSNICIAPHTGWDKISTSDNHNCAIDDGRMYCWGLNDEGQLGNNTTVNDNKPLLVKGLLNTSTGIQDPAFTDWINVSVGKSLTCGVRNNGIAYCWGRNNDGQIGDNTFTDRPTPTPVVGGFTDWNNVSVVGGEHVCGLRKNGEAYCWGSNNDGQLGNGTTTDSKIPVLVAGTWNMISAFKETSCGIRNRGEVACWGQNDKGAVMGTSTGIIMTPTTVPLPYADFIHVASHKRNTCAVRTNGDLWCWGRNKGQYGLGYANGNVYAPFKILGVTVKK